MILISGSGEIIRNVEQIIEVFEIDGNLIELIVKLSDQDARLISARDEAYIRIKTAGKENIGNVEGTNVICGCEYLKGKIPLLTRESRLLDPKLASQAIEVIKNDKYFSTGSTREYEESLAIAKEDESKNPKERRVFILPSYKDFTINRRKNFEVLEFLLQDLAEEYYQFNCSESIKFLLLNPNIFSESKYNGTILTYTYFCSIGNLFYGYTNQYFSIHSRAVRNKIYSTSTPYEKVLLVNVRSQRELKQTHSSNVGIDNGCYERFRKIEFD
jgi:hypothetical protein